jgi:rhodanese-related sulfurtransferase
MNWGPMKSIFVWFVLVFLLAGQPARSRPVTNAGPGNPAAAPQAGAPRKVGVEEFEKLWQDKKNVVLDVRTKQEFDAGHIPGAVNLDANAPGFTNKVAALDTNKVYLVHCAAGRRSANACEQMSQLGFSHLIDLAPGFRAWEKAGKPVER